MSETDRCPNYPRCSGDCPVGECELDEHFPGCHPGHAEDQRETPEGYQPQDTENCWHCRTPTTRGCNCDWCLDFTDGVPNAVYHCPLCRRYWTVMYLRVTKLTFGADQAAAQITDGVQP